MQQPLVVIIDDESDILDLLTYTFTRRGYAVKGFSGAREALEFIRGERPAIILCDWMMPEMDGISFTRYVKRNIELAEIPLVMVTCKNDWSAKRTALAAGVTDFISKPVRMDVLASRVQALLNRSQPGAATA